MLPVAEPGRPSRVGVPGYRPRGRPIRGAHRGRILIVEDDELIRDAMGPLLEGQGHQVAFAENGREALTWLHAHPHPDVIVLDLRMPVMNGWEFRAIQKLDPRLSLIPVVAVSADGSAQAAAISAQAYLHKPVDPDHLLATIENVLLERVRQASTSSDETRRFAYLKRLVAGIGHEINNPLTLVMLNLSQSLEALHPAIPSPQKPAERSVGPGAGAIEVRLASVAELLEECQIGAERISETVGNLQYLSYQGEVPSDWMDLHQVIDQSVIEARNRIRHRALLVRWFGRIPLIFGDDKALRQVFRTILTSAAESLPEGNRERNQIRVSTAVVAGDGRDEVVVEVSQSGNEMARDSTSAAFGDQTTSLFGDGAGMALSLCLETINRHHGRLMVGSVLGKGKVFRVFLPVSAPPEALLPMGATPSRQGMLVRKRILVIDDDIVVGRNVQRMLRDRHDVVLVQGATEGLKLLEDGEDFDLMICDVEMPGLNGPGFCAAVRQRWPQLRDRLVFMTGGAYSPEAVLFVEESALRILTKPFTAKRLKEFVRESLPPDE